MSEITIDVLKEIREEIVIMRGKCNPNTDEYYVILGLSTALNILDKKISEMEEK